MIALDKLRQPWMLDAACRGYRVDLWFPLDHDTAGNLIVDPIVLQRCAVCPVAGACLTYALEHQVDGIWAGTTPRSRRRLRRKRRISAQPLEHPDHIEPDPEPEERTAS